MFYVEGLCDWRGDCHACAFAAFEYASLEFHGYFNHLIRSVFTLYLNSAVPI